MMTVQEVADRYQCSTALVTGLLAKIGFRNAQSDTSLSAAVVHRFDKAWGDTIRAARPKPTPAFGGETDVPPTPARSASKPNVMRIAHARITGGRDAAGNRVPKLLDNPGTVHAIDAVGTRDGDPWRGEIEPGEVHFSGGPMNSGPYAACGRAHMRAVLGDEFVPADDPDAAGQCPRCAELVLAGKGFRNPPEPYHRSYFCETFLRIGVDGAVTVKDCTLRDFHDGPPALETGLSGTSAQTITCPLLTRLAGALRKPPEPFAPSSTPSIIVRLW